MCLAIYKPAKAIIPVENLENGYDGNPHGCGFCYSERGKLHVVKGMFTFDQFYKQYREKEHLPMLIHFRWATHASKNELNCHPFLMCDGRYALIHNGVISIHMSVKELSDTGNFARLVMDPMLKAGVHPRKPAFFYLVEQALGEGNKVAIMDNKGDVTIYNEDNGNHEDAIDKDGNEIIFIARNGEKYNEKVWYSNCGYKGSRRARSRQHQDEYSGYFDGGAGMCGVAEMNLADITGGNGEQLGPPIGMGIVTGFKPTGEKDAEESANAMSRAFEVGMPLIQRNGKYPPNVPANSDKKKDTIRIILPPKTSVDLNAPVLTPDTAAHTITEISSGPIFDAKTELELAWLVSDMNINRAKAIESLGLEIKDCVKMV